MSADATPLASTAMEAATELHGEYSDEWINITLATYGTSEHIAEYMGLNKKANAERNRIAAIFQKHFQPLLAKEEGERDQWKREAFDTLEKAKVELTALRADLAAKEAALERYMQRISSHDEGPCDHACGVCVKNAGADDSMVIPDHLCTYHEVCAALASRADKGGAT